jgi:hypothetical protein
MMNKYKVRVDIQIVEDSENDIDAVDDAVCKFVTEQEAESIDIMEKTVLQSSHEAIRRALSNHFTSISKKSS